MKAKRTLILVIFVLISLTTVTSCSSSTSAEVNSLQSQIESLKRENAELKGETYVENEKTTDTKANASVPTIETSSQYTTAALNQNISVPDVCEFTITGVSFGDEIGPPKPGDYSLYYYEIGDTANTYAEVICSLKNLGTSTVEPDDVISATLKFSGKYEYSCFIVGERDQGSDFDPYPDLKPLTTATLHCLFEVPDEVAVSSDSLECIINVDGSEYMIKLR